MIVYCPECMARYELPDTRKGIKFRCKKCSGVVYTDELRRVECPNPFATGAFPAIESPEETTKATTTTQMRAVPVPAEGRPGASALDALDDDLFDFSDTRALRDDTARAAVEEVERELALEAQQAKQGGESVVADLRLPPVEQTIPAAGSVATEVSAVEEEPVVEEEDGALIDFGAEEPLAPQAAPAATAPDAGDALALWGEEEEPSAAAELEPAQEESLAVLDEEPADDALMLFDEAEEAPAAVAPEAELASEDIELASEEEELVDFDADSAPMPAANAPVAALEDDELLEEDLGLTPAAAEPEEELLIEEAALAPEEEEELADFGSDSIPLPMASEPVAALEEDELLVEDLASSPTAAEPEEELLIEETALAPEEEEELADFGSDSIPLPMASEPVAALMEDELLMDDLAPSPAATALEDDELLVDDLDIVPAETPAAAAESADDLAIEEEPLVMEEEEDLADFGADSIPLPNASEPVAALDEDELLIDDLAPAAAVETEEDLIVDADFSASNVAEEELAVEAELSGDDPAAFAPEEAPLESEDAVLGVEAEAAAGEALDDAPLSLDEGENLPLADSAQPAVKIGRKVVHDDSDLTFLSDEEDASELPIAEVVDIHALFPQQEREVRAHCPSCQARYQLPAHYTSRTKLRCAVCGERVAVLPAGGEFPRPESAADLAAASASETGETVRLRAGATGAAVAAAAVAAEIAEEAAAVQEDLAEQIDLFAEEPAPQPSEEQLLTVEEETLPEGEAELVVAESPDNEEPLEVDLGELEEIAAEDDAEIELEITAEAEESAEPLTIDESDAAAPEADAPGATVRSSHRPSRTQPEPQEPRSESAGVEGAEDELFDFGNATRLANVITGSDSSVFTGISTDTTFAKKKEKTGEGMEDDEVVEW